MIQLLEVTEKEEQVLHHIMQFYIYEFSKYIPEITLEEDGTYKPFNLKPYWTEDSLHAFLLKKEEEIVGFALVKSQSENSPNTINEFFIIQKYSGRGYGKVAANQLFTMFPGKWVVTQIEKNYPAQAFWRSIISNYTNRNFTERYDEQKRSIQEFDTRLILKEI